MSIPSPTPSLWQATRALAAQDLRATNDRVLDISMKYGFDSQQTFTRLFTRKYRMSPGTWRKQGDAPTNH